MREDTLFTTIRRPQSQQEIETLIKQAEADGHGVYGVTHVVSKGPQVIGYVGLIPSIMMWMDSDRATSRDSLVALNFAQNILEERGSEIISLPCTEKSPFHGILGKIGFTNLGQSTLFLKNLKA